MTEQHTEKNTSTPDMSAVSKELLKYKGSRNLDILRLGEEIGTISCAFRIIRSDGTQTINLIFTPSDVTIWRSDHNSLTITDVQANLFASPDSEIWVSSAVNARLNEQQSESLRRKKPGRK